MKPVPCFAFALAAALALASAARAHDPFESWTEAIVQSDRLEVFVTMAQATALKLVDAEARVTALSPENFPALRDRFVREGAALFILTASRKPLPPREVTVELTEELDVAFKLVYARPAPGRLHFHAAFLKKLGEGYGGIVDVGDNAGHQFGWEQISWENPNLEVVVPSPPPPAAPPPTAPPPKKT